MDELLIGEKKYISSKQAAKATGYAKDYIGQLCREGRVPARLVGRSWYVLESAIQDHRFGNPANEPIKNARPEQTPAPLSSTWESPHYEASDAEVLPSVNQLRMKEPEPEENKEEEVVQRLQDTWQAWFDRFEHISEATEDKKDTQAERPEVRESAQEEIERSEEVQIPIHAVYPRYKAPPEELLPQYETASAQEREEDRKGTTRGGHTLWMRLVGVAKVTGVLIAALTFATAVLGSGYFDEYILSNSQARIIAGVALYNK